MNIPQVSVARSVADQLERASCIRRMFEEGARLKAERGAENIFDFTLGNPDLDPPAQVLSVLARLAAEHPPQIHGYMQNAGLPGAREAVAAHLATKTGLPFTPRHVLMTVGAAGACNIFLRSVLDPGDEVIVLAPFFPEYRFYIQNYGGRMVSVETDENFFPVVERIAEAVTPRTKAVLLNTPNNPTGRIYPEKLLRDLGRMIDSLDHPVTVLSDEPYVPLVFDGRAHPQVVTLIRRTVIAHSWSKTFAIPGERIGYLAISPRLPEAGPLAEACAFSTRALGYVNAPALWQRVVTETIEVKPDIGSYQERRDRMYEGLTRLGYSVSKAEGTFYLFPKSPVADDAAFIRLLAAEGVLAVPGSDFGRGGYFRLALTVPTDHMDRSLPAFGRALESSAFS